MVVEKSAPLLVFLFLDTGTRNVIRFSKSADFTSDWHVYTVDWLPDRIVMSIDNETVGWLVASFGCFAWCHSKKDPNTYTRPHECIVGLHTTHFAFGFGCCLSTAVHVPTCKRSEMQNAISRVPLLSTHDAHKQANNIQKLTNTHTHTHTHTGWLACAVALQQWCQP